ESAASVASRGGAAGLGSFLSFPSPDPKSQPNILALLLSTRCLVRCCYCSPAACEPARPFARSLALWLAPGIGDASGSEGAEFFGHVLAGTCRRVCGRRARTQRRRISASSQCSAPTDP